MASIKRNVRTRSALVVAVAMLAAVALPVVGVAIAQTPAPPTIEFLNPSGHSMIVSDKDAGGDGTYRLSAWVQNVPENPLVEFELVVGAGTTTLGPAVRMGDDTWEYQWNIPNSVLDGPHTIRAILFSNLEEVDRDEAAVTIRHGQPASQTAAARAEIAFPENGGAPGFYLPPHGDRANTLIDVVSSSDTTFIRARYTTSQPGTEPAWTVCGTENRNASQNGVRCLLAAGVHPASVTGLSVVANTSNPNVGYQANFDGAGDAVRVLPYMQVPTTVSTALPLLAPADDCSPTLTANVVDQFGRRIAAVNMDAHATGPTDQLKFDTDNIFSSPSANQPPDSGNHTTEPGYSCFDDLIDFSDLQGEHNRAGQADVKHVESTGGTNDDGNWAVALYSPDMGDTQVTLWADLADNDTYCGNDPAAHSSVRWVADPNAVDEGGNPIHQPAPASPEAPLIADCPAPPPFGTTSPTPTQTATSSPTPTNGEQPTVGSGPCRGYEHGSSQPRPGGQGGMIIVGTHGSDILHGTEGPDIICGLGGDDIIRGFAGNDNLYGNQGDDDIRGGSGADIVVGGPGDDTLYGNKGSDTLRGGRGEDVLRGGKGPDILQGGAGNDVIFGGRGHDTLRGGPGDDELFGGRGNDRLNGGPGVDLCRGGRGNNSFRNCERR